jgi:radical SAM superfamily enzyme YgiQ (UPF0313 family)
MIPRKIVFCYPDYQLKVGKKNRVEIPRLGMLHICAVAEEEGFNVEVVPVDINTSPESIPEADIYAYSITATVTYPIFQRLVPSVKQRAKIHIAGNTHVNIFPNQVLDELELDAVFKGEGEVSFRSWIKNKCADHGVIPGTPADVNKVPFPARHLLPNDRILLNHWLGGKFDNVVVIWSSRGCVYNCAYCANLNNGSSRLRTPQNFQKEIWRIKELYPQVQGLMVLDEMFTFNPRHAISIAEVISRENLFWECTTRADFLQKDVTEALVNSNCIEVKLG